MPLSTWRLMMKRLLINGLFFLCLPSALARDPFAPPQASCLATLMSLEHWQLQGMVGRGSHYLGWLRSPQGERLAIASDRPLPFAGWQIDTFTPFHLALSAPHSCVPQHVTLQIKGRYHAKDGHRVAADKRDSRGP